MSDLVLSIGVSNLLVSVVLAAAAALVHAKARRPWLAHLLWLLVLVKLVTPPLVSTSWITFGAAADRPATAAPVGERSFAPGAFDAALPSVAANLDAATAAATTWSPATVLTWLWIVGSAAILLVSIVRVARFDRLLRRATVPGDERLERMASGICEQLGLRRVPQVRVVRAELAPLVWWVGGRVRVVLPQSVAEGLDPRALRLVLAHELGHVRRRDHVVRWLEWGATVLFWWNPILWLARRGLRANEEICCDALVVERLRTSPNTYANSILDAIELMATPALRPPVPASQMTSGGALENRLTMLVSDRTVLAPSRLARLLAAVFAAVVLPLGVASAQAPDYEAVGSRLMEAVESGELSESQAQAMFGALAEQHFAEELAARRAEKQHRHDLELHRADAERTRLVEELDTLRLDLENLVLAGELSELEARMKMEEARRRLIETEQALEEKERWLKYEAFEKDVRAALERGEISYEEAEAKLAEVKAKMFGAYDSRVEAEGARIEWIRLVDDATNDYQRAVDQIDALVDAGQMSEFEAREKLRRLELERLDTELVDIELQLKSRVDETFAKTVEGIKKLVEAGELSEFEADQKILELEMKYYGHVHEKQESKHEHSAKELEDLELQLKKFVESGLITEDEAKQKLLDAKADAKSGEKHGRR